MRYVSRLISAGFLCLSIYSCNQDLNYVEFPYQHFGREVKSKIGTVLFDKSSYHVSQREQKNIMALARVLSLYERYNDNQRIRIIGYSDQDGDVLLNLNLGLARAEEVGRLLEVYGISMTRAKIASYGESRTYTNDATSRKVEVWLENDPWAFLKSQLFIYIVLSVVISFLIGYITHRLLKTNYRT
ncbi:MAG: OmpA family protein [Spirochaetia bacterium]|nr:OmpA family protein [Spirochaetia bacterium]